MHVLSVSLHELQCVISRFANLDKFVLKALKSFLGYILDSYPCTYYNMSECHHH